MDCHSGNSTTTVPPTGVSRRRIVRSASVATMRDRAGHALHGWRQRDPAGPKARSGDAPAGASTPGASGRYDRPGWAVTPRHIGAPEDVAGVDVVPGQAGGEPPAR